MSERKTAFELKEEDRTTGEADKPKTILAALHNLQSDISGFRVMQERILAEIANLAKRVG